MSEEMKKEACELSEEEIEKVAGGFECNPESCTFTAIDSLNGETAVF